MAGNVARFLNEVNKQILIYTISFYIWSVVFYVVCILIIVLPIIIAGGFLDDATARVVAAASAVFSALATWSNLGIVAGNFGHSRDKLLSARADYDVNGDLARLKTAYDEALKMAMSWSPSTPSNKA